MFSKKIDLYRAVFYLSETPSLPMTPYVTPPPYTLYSVYVYTVYLFTQGRGGEGESYPERRLEGQQFTKPVENTNMTDCISRLLTLLNTSKDDIQGLVSLSLISPCFIPCSLLPCRGRKRGTRQFSPST